MKILNHYKEISKDVTSRVLKVQMDQEETRSVKTGHCNKI
jgi:hypothetical protein